MLISKQESSQLIENASHYAVFQIFFVVLVIILSSVGAFFHFLLDHEIGIVEAWLHNNQWEILIISKVASLYLLNKWFKIKLYQLRPLSVLFKELIKWPEIKSVVTSAFMVIACLTLGKVQFIDQNLGYWYYQLTSYIGLVLFFGIEFIAIAYLEEILGHKLKTPKIPLFLTYLLLFGIAFRMSVPDYYGLLPFVLLCFCSLLYLSGDQFKSWSNVVCFLLLFVAPMGALFGWDPVWGDDFSLFRLSRKLNFTFLAIIWMISFGYYNYRDKIIASSKKLLR